MISRTFFLIMTGVSVHLFAQTAPKDSAFYISRFIWDKVDTILTTDFSRISKPASVESFNPCFHNPPVRQDTTGSCWAFSSVSFLESEIFRLHGKKIKLSEMYIVYWEYVEKARRYVRHRGNSHFEQGSEEDATLLKMKEYGAVRSADYSGLNGQAQKYNHDKMIKEMIQYLDFIRKNDLWDEDIAIAHIRLILDKHMGKPPDRIRVGKKWITPLEFFEQEMRLSAEDYVSFMSFSSQPFYLQGEYKVEDNWWHSNSYYNVPLKEWYGAIVGAIRNGYPVALGGDVSEPGKGRWDDVCIVPSFDIPGEYIDQSSREFRFDNKTTTDDHGIHLLGYQKIGDWDWFLIKDSGSSAFEGLYPGYYFYRGDFIQLKMLTFMVHKDAVKELLLKCHNGGQ